MMLFVWPAPFRHRWERPLWRDLWPRVAWQVVTAILLGYSVGKYAPVWSWPLLVPALLWWSDRCQQVYDVVYRVAFGRPAPLGGIMRPTLTVRRAVARWKKKPPAAEGRAAGG